MSDLCISYETDQGISTSEPFAITVASTEEETTEEEVVEEEVVITCSFYLLSVSDVTVTTAEMTSGSFDLSSMMSGTPSCVSDVSTVSTGCFDLYSSGTYSALLVTQADFMGSTVSIFLDSSYTNFCIAFSSDYGVIASEPFSITVEDPEPEV
jgi:hypothetical protein